MQDQRITGGEYADLGSRLSKAFSLYTANPIPFIIIGLMTLPFTILTGLWTWGIVFAIPGFIIQEVVYGAGAIAAYAALNGKANAGTAIQAAIDRLGQLIEVSLRYVGAALLLGITIIGIPWAIRLLVRWFFATQALMLQDMPPKAAISESCRLVDGDWWRVLGNLLLVGLLTSVPSIIFRVAIGGAAGLVVSAIISIVVGPIMVIFQTLFYLRLRQEKIAAMTPPPPDLTPEVA